MKINKKMLLTFSTTTLTIATPIVTLMSFSPNEKNANINVEYDALKENKGALQSMQFLKSQNNVNSIYLIKNNRFRNVDVINDKDLEKTFKEQQESGAKYSANVYFNFTLSKWIDSIYNHIIDLIICLKFGCNKPFEQYKIQLNKEIQTSKLLNYPLSSLNIDSFNLAKLLKEHRILHTNLLSNIK